MQQQIKRGLLLMALSLAVAGRASIFVDNAKHTVKFSATATGVVAGTPVEFFFIDSDSDRDYEAVFTADDDISEIAMAFDKAGIPLGTPVRNQTCRFWPAGSRVIVSPDPWQYVTDNEIEAQHHLPVIYTGGERDATGAPVAATNMPEAIFAFYGLGQSFMLLDDALDQSVAYGRFTASCALEKGTRVEFTVSWDGTSATKPYNLMLTPGRIKESFSQMRGVSSELGLDVLPNFSPELTVSESVSAANALAALDSRQVRVNGYEEGQFFYRAFLPRDEWRDRRERLTQPLEVRFDGTNAVYTVIDEDWSVEGFNPKLTPRTVDIDEAKRFKTDTCLVFTPETTKLGLIYELKGRLPANIINWYIYID